MVQATVPRPVYGKCPYPGCPHQAVWSPPNKLVRSYRVKHVCPADHHGAMPYWAAKRFGVGLEAMGLELSNQIVLIDGQEYHRIKDREVADGRQRVRGDIQELGDFRQRLETTIREALSSVRAEVHEPEREANDDGTGPGPDISLDEWAKLLSEG
mgnify:CR=1 FL=1